MLRHTKSNGILIAKDGTTVGLGTGQVSRVDAVHMALRKGGENVKGGVLASDAFFPFRDSIDTVKDSGISTIIQPGGSIRDQEVIDACNEYGFSMIFTMVPVSSLFIHFSPQTLIYFSRILLGFC